MKTVKTILLDHLLRKIVSVPAALIDSHDEAFLHAIVEVMLAEVFAPCAAVPLESDLILRAPEEGVDFADSS